MTAYGELERCVTPSERDKIPNNYKQKQWPGTFLEHLAFSRRHIFGDDVN